MRSINAAAGSIVSAAAITARTSSTVITERTGVFAERSRAMLATLVPTQPHRTACASAARSTPCWFLMPASRIPRVAQPGVPPLDVADRQTGDGEPGDLIVLDPSDAALLITRRRWCPRLEVLADPRVEDVADGAAARRDRVGVPSISLATRIASRLPPWIVLEIWLGRPRASLPVNTRTSHTPRRF